MKKTVFQFLLVSLLSFGATTFAQAATITIDIQEQERQFSIFGTATDTIVEISGAIDLTGLNVGANAGFKFESAFRAEQSLISLRNSTSTGPRDQAYTFDVVGPSNIGLGGLSFAGATSKSGGTFFFTASNGRGGVLLPDNYVSGAAISTTAVLFNRSIASFGLSEGRYEYTFSGNNLIFIIGDPQPDAGSGPSQVPTPGAGFLLLGTAIGGFTLSYRRKSKKPSS